MQPAAFIARVRADAAAEGIPPAAAARTAWHALTFEERLELADAIPECGHALAELTAALGPLEREVAALVERDRAA